MLGRTLPFLRQGGQPAQPWKRCAGTMPGGPFVPNRFMPCASYFTSLSTQGVIDLRYENLNDEKAEQ